MDQNFRHVHVHWLYISLFYKSRTSVTVNCTEGTAVVAEANADFILVHSWLMKILLIRLHYTWHWKLVNTIQNLAGNRTSTLMICMNCMLSLPYYSTALFDGYVRIQCNPWTYTSHTLNSLMHDLVLVTACLWAAGVQCVSSPHDPPLWSSGLLIMLVWLLGSLNYTTQLLPVCLPSHHLKAGMCMCEDTSQHWTAQSM